MIQAGGKTVFLGGNIGTPLSEYALRREKSDWVVVEVSSFQLDTSFEFKPHVAVFLNIAPDHLDRYPTYEDYANSKMKLKNNMSEEDYVIVNMRDPKLMAAMAGIKPKQLYFSSDNMEQMPPHYAEMLWDWSLRGGLAFSEVTDVPDPKGELLLEHYFDVVTPKHLQGEAVDTWEFTVKGEVKEDDLTVRIFAANHIPDTAATVEESIYTTGLVVDGRVLISGDTKFDLAMIQRLAPQCEVIFHDCQHFPGGVHANYQQLKTLAPEVKAKMTLYHLSDGMLDIDVKADGFAGLMEPAPVVYDF